MDLVLKLLNVYDKIMNLLPRKSNAAKKSGPDIAEVMKTFATEASKMPFKFEIDSSEEVKAFLSDLHKVSLAMNSQIDLMTSNLTRYAKNMQLDKMPRYLAATGYKLQQTSDLFNGLLTNADRTIVAFYRLLESLKVLSRLVCVCVFAVTVFYLHRRTAWISSETGKGSENSELFRKYLTYLSVLLTALSPIWIFGVRLFP